MRKERVTLTATERFGFVLAAPSPPIPPYYTTFMAFTVARGADK